MCEYFSYRWQQILKPHSKPPSLSLLFAVSWVGSSTGRLEAPFGELVNVSMMPSQVLRCQRLHDVMVADCQKPNVIGGYRLLKYSEFFFRSRVVIAWHFLPEIQKTEPRSSSQINRGSCSDW